MKIIVCEILAIHQLVYCARIITIVWQNIYVWRASTDLINFHLLSLRVEHFNTGEPEVVHISPSFQNVKFENLPRWQGWNRQYRIILFLLYLGWLFNFYRVQLVEIGKIF